MAKGSSATDQRLANLGWLRDAPLFIDESGISRMYEAVVRPTHSQGPRIIKVTSTREASGRLGASSEAKLGLGKIWEVLGLGSAELKLQAQAEGGGKAAATNEDTRTLEPIHTPERMLAQITAVYLAEHEARLKTPTSPVEITSYADLLETPRVLLFLDLPGMMTNSGKPLRIIPTAAEFTSGKIELLYRNFETKLERVAPDYPDAVLDSMKRRGLEQEYWAFFQNNYSATKAIEVIEEAASVHGRIQWIDYRLPLDDAGSTLHLHVSPGGKWDTGVLAYHFVRRGFKHGIRLVGTLKSEPTMDVLAIFGK